MKIILHWIILSLAVLAAAHFVPGIAVASFAVALIVGACLTVIVLVAKPILDILTLPINLLTFGLFHIVVNAAIFYFLGTFIAGFTVATIIAALFGAAIISAINWVGDKIFY